MRLVTPPAANPPDTDRPDTSSPSSSSFGLPPTIRACLFDLDGVLTDTASVHQAAWKQMFDDFLAGWQGGPADADVRPFTRDDYLSFVDGKPRLDGVRDFLASRQIELPEGADGDAPESTTVHGLGERKNALVQERIDRDGVQVYPGSLRYLQAAAAADLRRAVVSSSANTAQVLAVTGLDALVEVRVDGVTARERGLRGKPAADTYLAGAQELGVTPAQAAVFEDAVSGVQAGSAGRFGFVVGVDRSEPGSGHGDDLRASGADTVVADLAELLGGGR